MLKSTVSLPLGKNGKMLKHEFFFLPKCFSNQNWWPVCGRNIPNCYYRVICIPNFQNCFISIGTLKKIYPKKYLGSPCVIKFLWKNLDHKREKHDSTKPDNISPCPPHLLGVPPVVLNNSSSVFPIISIALFLIIVSPPSLSLNLTKACTS